MSADETQQLKSPSKKKSSKISKKGGNDDDNDAGNAAAATTAAAGAAAASSGLSEEVLSSLGNKRTVVRLAAQSDAVKLDSVVVFADRAEVVRGVDLGERSAGLYALVLEGFSERVVADSIRVEPITPSNITIVEVSSELSETSAARKSAKQVELEARVVAANKVVSELQSDKATVLAQMRWLDDYAQSVRSTPSNQQTIEFVGNFIKFVGDQRQSLNARQREVESSIAAANAEIAALRDQIAEEDALAGNLVGPKRNITVVVFIPADGNAGQLRLSMIVTGCSWQPSYDCRIASVKDAKMQLIYYGQVLNGTGEHWTDAAISLSTAAPEAGQPPKLQTLHVVLRDIGYRSYHPYQQASNANPLYEQQQMMPQQQQFSIASNAMDITSRTERAPMPPRGGAFNDNNLLTPAVVDDEEDAADPLGDSDTTSTFVITGRKTIASDHKDHKLTIAMFTLPVDFTHTAIPKSGRVYLRGSSKTKHQLLAGPMSVFLASKFVCLVSIKAVPPNSSFNVFLGVDSAVTLKVLPEKQLKAQTGRLFKQRVSNTRRLIELRNGRNEPVNISLFEQLPLSSEDRAKVKLLEPTDLEKNGVVLNEHNNLRFQFVLQPQEKKTIKVEYEISYPTDKEISIEEW
jgi:hypothetical protein